MATNNPNNYISILLLIAFYTEECCVPQVCRLAFAINDRFRMEDTFACNVFICRKKGKLFDGGNDRLKPWSVVESTPVIHLGD
ncbi:hypothetical protein FLL60_12440 [Vibrio cholerae]|nr:hypothetical protein FLL60_12440 [Vibrio cholerae]